MADEDDQWLYGDSNPENANAEIVKEDGQKDEENTQNVSKNTAVSIIQRFLIYN